MSDDKDDRQAKIDKLLRFLARPSNNGGVYLISGQRGVGKTTLVEKVLNKDNAKTVPCLAYFSGRIGRRTPLQVVRHPRGLKRTLLKIDVDAMLPIESPDATGEIQDEVTRYTRLLLLNICFALTNAIDSRFSIRRHGRVLRERLGFFRYWFGNALLWPGHEDRKLLIRVAAMLSIVQFLVWYFIKLWVYETNCCQINLLATLALILLPWLICFGLRKLVWWLVFVAQLGVIASFEYQLYSIIPCWVHLLLGAVIVIAPIGCWMFLRWLDWRSLQKISAHLYDLAHASQYQQNQDTSNDTQRDERVNLSLILSLMLLTTVVWLIEPEVIEKIYQLLTAKLFSGSLPESDLKVISLTLKHMLQLLLPTALVLTLVYSRTQKHHDGRNSKFDKTNPAWMINLLRRYLFLCHRCGLEPVLVVDELDKLYDLDVFVDKTGDSKPKRFAPIKPAKPDRMNIFLLALSRLKASLGAEFVWILIGDPNFHDKLQQHRHERLDGNLGFLATVIHQEEVLGPMSLATAEDYMQNNWQLVWDKLLLRECAWKKNDSFQLCKNPNFAVECERGKDIGDEQRKVLWLRSYGNFSTLVRECENLKAPFFVTHFQKNLISAIVELWEVESINNFLAFEYTPEVLDAVRDEWVYIWIRSGILDAGNRLIKPALPGKDFFLGLSELLDIKDKEANTSRNLRTLEEIHAIRYAEPTLLRAAGAMILYRFLKQKRLIKDGRSKDSIEIINDSPQNQAH
jgi:hypothetical protein